MKTTTQNTNETAVKITAAILTTAMALGAIGYALKAVGICLSNGLFN